MMRKAGFSLTELLVMVSLCGVVASFTIPKVFTSYQSNQRDAVMKDVVQTLCAVEMRGMTRGDITASNSWAYFSRQLNAVKVCPNNASTEGCWTQASPSSEQQSAPGFVLPGGAALAGFETQDDADSNGSVSGSYGEQIIVDWNGSAGPNKEGKDQIQLFLSYGSRNYQGVIPGGVGPASETSTILYHQIFD